MTNFVRQTLTALALFCWSFSGLSQDIELSELSQEVLQRTNRVESFQHIAQLAERLGLKAYLFGGSAAAWAHYVHWDLLREAGDRRYRPDRFSYTYVDIFRSNQDMDIVIDGTPEQAHEFQSVLAEKFPFFQGNKTVWEVRPLGHSIGDKEALLNNPDFLNQHTDSNSTGLIELSTNPRTAEIRDVRDWSAGEQCQFIKDVHEQKLHYYYSENHNRTARFKDGKNPPILSVIRYLTKSFQFELEIGPEVRNLLRRIVMNFDYANIDNQYVRDWINKNGAKLYQNAVNLEYASSVLEDIGLKQKLSRVGDVNNSNDLAWWMNKEPLKSKGIGLGRGASARDLGIDIVAHETNSFSAWESIIKSHENVPNVFISRKNGNGEGAVYGDGFYTRKGLQGARGTGITIRFKLHPLAREGVDFELYDDYVLIKNKNALTVIHEDLSWTLPEYFEKILQGFEFDSSDRAVKYKLKQKILKNAKSLDGADLDQTYKLVNEYFENPNASNVSTVYTEWLDLNLPENYRPTGLQIVKALMVGFKLEFLDTEQMAKLPNLSDLVQADLVHIYPLVEASFDQPVIELIPFYTEWLKLNLPAEYNLTPMQFMKAIDIGLDVSKMDPLLYDRQISAMKMHIRSLTPNQLTKFEKEMFVKFKELFKINSEFKDMSQLVQYLHSDDWDSYRYSEKGKKIYRWFIEYCFLKPTNSVVPELLQPFMVEKNLSLNEAMIDFIFGHPVFEVKQELIKLVIEQTKDAHFKTELFKLARHTFSKPAAENMQDLIRLTIENGNQEIYRTLAKETFSQPHTANMEDLVILLIKRGDAQTLEALVEYVFTQPHSLKMTKALKLIVKNADAHLFGKIGIHIFHRPHSLKWRDILKTAITEVSNQHTLKWFSISIFSRPHTKDMHEELRMLIMKAEGEALGKVAEEVFSQPHAEHMEDLVRLYVERADPDNMSKLIHHALNKPHMHNMRGIIKLLVDRNEVYINRSLSSFFSEPHSLPMRDLLEVMIRNTRDMHSLHNLFWGAFGKPHAVGMEDLIRLALAKGDAHVMKAVTGSVFTESIVVQNTPWLQSLIAELEQLPEWRQAEHAHAVVKKLPPIVSPKLSCFREELIEGIAK